MSHHCEYKMSVDFYTLTAVFIMLTITRVIFKNSLWSFLLFFSPSANFLLLFCYFQMLGHAKSGTKLPGWLSPQFTPGFHVSTIPPVSILDYAARTGRISLQRVDKSWNVFWSLLHFSKHFSQMYRSCSIVLYPHIQAIFKKKKAADYTCLQNSACFWYFPLHKNFSDVRKQKTKHSMTTNDVP